MSDRPALETRFTQPDHWRAGDFVNLSTGHKIHYGTATPADAKGVVVILPGLSEFGEKYFETARDLLSRGFAVWVIDWAYQGRASRYAPHAMRRHSDGFEADIHDLHKLISEHVIPAANGAPLIMLGHSMGGHLGLRYLAQHAGLFQRAIFTAPMIGINDIRTIPPVALNILLYALRPFYGRYVPGGRDWHEAMRKSDGTDVFSSDPARARLHNAWSLACPALQVGSPTVRWLYEAVQSCRGLMPRLSRINTPVLLVSAGQDRIVDNTAIERAVSLMPAAEALLLPEARHEILMERDAIRNRFFEAFDKWVQGTDSQ